MPKRTAAQKAAVARRGKSTLPDAAQTERRSMKKGPPKQFPYSLRISFRSDQEKWLDKVADDQDVSINEVVRAAVDRMMEIGHWPEVR